MVKPKGEKMGFRLPSDLREYIEELQRNLMDREEKAISRSEVLRRIIIFHKHLRESKLSEILKNPYELEEDGT